MYPPTATADSGLLHTGGHAEDGAEQPGGEDGLDEHRLDAGCGRRPERSDDERLEVSRRTRTPSSRQPPSRRETPHVHTYRAAGHLRDAPDNKGAAQDQGHPDHALVADGGISTMVPSSRGLTSDTTPSRGKCTAPMASPGSKSTTPWQPHRG